MTTEGDDRDELCLYWLSFVVPELPRSSPQHFLGATIVRARSEHTAEQVARVLDVHPGGDVRITMMGPARAALVGDDQIGVLMTREQANSFKPSRKTG